MRQRMILAIFLASCFALGLGLVQRPAVPAATMAGDKSAAARTEPVVYLAGKLSDEEMITFTASVAAGGQGGVVLLDTPRSRAHTKEFLATLRPKRIVPVGAFPLGLDHLMEKLGAELPLEKKEQSPVQLWGELFPEAEHVVVCPPKPRALLLQSACLAGALRAPLFVTRGHPDEAAELRRRLADWHAREVFAVGKAAKICYELPAVRVFDLEDEKAVFAACLEQQRKKGPLPVLVVTNPHDVSNGFGLSSFAPFLAIERRAALLCTNESGDNAARVVRTALEKPELARADALLFVADLKSIPMERRPNPVPGKDAFIEMEPGTPAFYEPCTFATGRLFHEDPGVLLLTLARQRLLLDGPDQRERKALIVSNPGGGLSLLETFSRNTAMELQNVGYKTATLFDEEVTPQKVRRLMPLQDIFLWEGHYRTMVDTYGLPKWTETLQPSLIFLQSCLALNEAEAQPLLRRGAISIVGCSTRTYSGTGGAFTLAFFDALLYENRSLGGALRQAKNYLTTYALLKKKRLGDNAKLAGANLRSAWAFTLWGDPTLKLPRPKPARDPLPAVKHRLEGQTLVVTVPREPYPRVAAGGFQAQMRPNERLAGLLSPDTDSDEKRLVPLVFLEVSLPHVPAGKTPHLHSRLPSRRWVFQWDARRQSGYLLLVPHAEEPEDIRFQVRWDE